MKYLIVGLGNIGNEYAKTRHNVGFRILDAFAEASNISFTDKRYGAMCEVRIKNKILILLKPSTYMNLSGNAVSYWMKAEKIPLENILVIVDDLALPFGTIRLKGKGSDAGHNGLKNIQSKLETKDYARLRFGIGNNFPKGGQIDYVLDSFTKEEERIIEDEKIPICIDLIKSFCLSGIAITMNEYNNK